MRNEISNAVLAGDNSEKLDANCKRVLANKQIAAAILQECAEEYKGLSLEQIIPYIEGNPQISEVPTEPDLTGKYLAEQRVNGISNELASLYEGTVKFDVIVNLS